MATISKRVSEKTGKTTGYQVKIRMKGFKPLTDTFPTRELAEAWAKVTESEMIRGTFIEKTEADSTTLDMALKRYSENVTINKKGAVREMQRIRRWMHDPLSNNKLSSIRRSDIASWRDTQLAAGSSKATVRNELMLLSAVYKKCASDWGMESLVNPVTKIAPSPGANERERRLEEGEEKRVFDAIDQGCRSPYVVAAIKFALASCARRSEVVSLRWDSVDLRDNTARLLDTKNGENRTIPLSPDAMAILNALPRRQDGKVFGVHLEAPTRAFTRAVRHARKEYESECARDGVTPSPSFLVNLRLHDLRHEGTTRLFEDLDFSLMEIASVTGHKTLSMLKRYTHLRAKNLAQKMRKPEEN